MMESDKIINLVDKFEFCLQMSKHTNTQQCSTLSEFVTVLNNERKELTS